jgi:hypothetical protein
VRHFNFFLIVSLSVILSLFTFHQPSHAQFDDIPHEEITVDLGLAGDRGSQSNSLTAVLPVPTVHGWVGVHALKTTAAGTVLSEVVKGHAQGGHRFGNFGLEMFVNAERNLAQGTDLTTAVGYFIRPGIYERSGWQISGGVGNFVENTDARDELGLTDADGSVIRWLAFSSIDYKGITTLIKATPISDLSDFQLEISPAVKFELKSNISLGISASWEYDSDPLTEENTHISYLTVLRLGF